MTIENPEFAELYHEAKNTAAFRGTLWWECAVAADRAYDRICQAGENSSRLKVPNDDRAENLVHQIFGWLCRHNGLL